MSGNMKRKMEINNAEKLYTTMETSRRLGYQGRTPHTILKLVKEGQLQAIRINARVIRIPESAIQRFLTKNST